MSNYFMVDKNKPKGRRDYAALRKTLIGLTVAPVLAASVVQARPTNTALDHSEASRHEMKVQVPRPVNLALASKLEDAPQFIFLGDTNHKDMSIRNFMANEETMETLASVGVKKLCVEMPSILQKKADDLVQGKITRNEFIDRMSQSMVVTTADNQATVAETHGRTADMILNAGKHGISVHFVDTGANDASVFNDAVGPTMEKFLEHVEMEMAKAIAKNPEIEKLPEIERVAWNRNFSAKLAQQQPPEIQKKMEADFLRARLKGDEETARYIGRIAGKDKTAIFYGINHIADVRGCLQEKTLPMVKGLPGNVMKIALAGSHASMPEGDYSMVQKFYVAGAGGALRTDAELKQTTYMPGQTTKGLNL